MTKPVVRGGRERRAAAWISAATALLVGTTALAQSGRTVVLDYSRGPGAQACPDEQAVRRAVMDRLGYDPFRPAAAAVVTASIKRAQRGFRADVTLGDGKGKIEGARELASPENDCGELAQAMALAISIAVDPMSASRGPAAPAAQPPAPADPEAAPPDAPPPMAAAPDQAAARRSARLVAQPSSAPQDPIMLRTSAGVVAGYGTAPGVSTGLAVQLGIRRGWLSAGLEGRADGFVSERAEPRGEVSASLLLMSLVPCAHRGLLVACALGSLGAIHGVGSGVPRAVDERTLFGSVGLRGGVELPISEWLSARLHGDLAATLTPTTLHLNEGTEEWSWSTPAVWVAAGLAAQASFP